MGEGTLQASSMLVRLSAAAASVRCWQARRGETLHCTFCPQVSAPLCSRPARNIASTVPYPPELIDRKDSPMLDISSSAHLSCNEVYAFACSRPRMTPRAYDVIDALGKNGDDGWVITYNCTLECPFARIQLAAIPKSARRFRCQKADQPLQRLAVALDGARAAHLSHTERQYSARPRRGAPSAPSSTSFPMFDDGTLNFTYTRSSTSASRCASSVSFVSSHWLAS